MTKLLAITRIIDLMNEKIGRAISWLALLMILVQFAVVVMRYIFGLGSIFMQESIVYMHALIFLVAAGYTLLHDDHVRVDIFYSRLTERYKAVVDLIGTLLFLMPSAVFIIWMSQDYISVSWRVRESSADPSGMPYVYLLKTTIFVLAVLLLVQGISELLKSIRQFNETKP